MPEMRWRSAQIFLPVLFVMLLCAQSVAALHHLWTDWSLTTFTHGYLVAGTSAWLLWRSTHDIPPQCWQPDLKALPVLVVIALFWLFCKLAGLQAIELLVLPLLLAAAIHLCWGSTVSRRSAFAVAYLWFAMPVWDELSEGLQWITVHVTRALLRLTGVPSYFDGSRIQLPSGSFEIEAGCSGLHYLIVALAIAALLGELRGDRIGRRLKLLALAALLAVVANWIRVFVVVLVGHVTHMQHPLVVESHYGFGWAVFALLLVLFLVIERRISGGMPPIAGTTPVPIQSTRPLAGLVATLLVVAVFSSWHRLATRPYQGEWSPTPVPSGWQQTGEAGQSWGPVFTGLDAEQLGRWEKPGEGAIDRYLGLYRRQAQGKEFSGFHNRPTGPEAQDNSRFAVTYRVGSAEYDSPMPAQLGYALRALAKLRAPPSEVQVLRSTCLPDCATAERLLVAWKD